MVNRTQVLVLGFFLLVLFSLIVIRLTAPGVYEQALRLRSGDRGLEITFLGALVAVISLVTLGVIRRWRWLFWLLIVVFLAGLLRVPVVILQLTGVLAADTPIWYLLLQGFLGLVQCAIGLAMVAGYRRAGVWGAF